MRRGVSIGSGMLCLVGTLFIISTTAGLARNFGVLDTTKSQLVKSVSLSMEGSYARISLPEQLQGQALYLLFYSPDPKFKAGRATLLGATQRSFFVDPLTAKTSDKCFYSALVFPQGLNTIVDEVMIEDFETGIVNLTSYPGQDLEPNRWEITSLATYDSSLFSLLLYGNTWKVESITPVAVTAGTVWRVAVRADDVGEVQAFGVGDGSHELIYQFEGSQLQTDTQWNTTFHSVADPDEWALLNIPVGRDWQIRYNTLPVIDRFFYVNDIDGFGNSTSFFDEIHDITEDLPNVPQVFISAVGDSSQIHPTYQFTSTVIDPDSPTHFYHWDFGDSTFSSLPNPTHTYASRAYRTVSLQVRDSDSLFADAAKHLLPPPGIPMPEFTLNAAGDVMLARRYEEAGGIIPTYGVNYIFQRIRPMFTFGADYNMVNLECPLTNQGYVHPTKDYTFRGNPANVSGLVYAGVDYAALGNNHTTDYMAPGLAQTVHVVDSVGIRFSGSGLDDYWATRPAFFTQNGIRVAVLSYCNRDGREDFLPPFLEAGYNKAGFAMFDEPTLEATIPAVDSLADLIIVQVHAGTEYDPSPLAMYGPDYKNHPLEDYERFNTDVDSIDRILKHRAIELGADLVICHHPHVLQGFEVYQGKLIAHSMGNFAFDQTYWETYLSCILYCKATLSGFTDFSFRPVYIDDYVPTPATGELSEDIMRMLAGYSKALNAETSYDSATGTGRIAIEPGSISETTRDVVIPLTLTTSGSYKVSQPVRVQDPGFLSAIVSISGISSGTIQASMGRDKLLMGGMEYEGGWLWATANNDIYQENMYPHSGTYCLAVRRAAGQSYLAAGLEDRIPIKENARYTIDGFMAGSNANDARFGTAIYQYRTSGGSLQDTYITGQSGSFGWTRSYKELTSPAGGWYLDFKCRNAGAGSNTGYGLFDDVALIEWTNNWSNVGSGFTAIPYPSDNVYIQIRTTANVTTATLTYRMTDREIQ
ncbi:MAG: CapA family protein [bacterium]|nr:CapA family protein [bacterium]